MLPHKIQKLRNDGTYTQQKRVRISYDLMVCERRSMIPCNGTTNKCEHCCRIFGRCDYLQIVGASETMRWAEVLLSSLSCPPKREDGSREGWPCRHQQSSRVCAHNTPPPACPTGGGDVCALARDISDLSWFSLIYKTTANI